MYFREFCILSYGFANRSQNRDGQCASLLQTTSCLKGGVSSYIEQIVPDTGMAARRPIAITPGAMEAADGICHQTLKHPDFRCKDIISNAVCISRTIPRSYLVGSRSPEKKHSRQNFKAKSCVTSRTLVKRVAFFLFISNRLWFCGCFLCKP